jgi:glycosyltransferase involved in cell wall biosynthesis
MIEALNGAESVGRVAGHSGPMFTIFIPTYNRAYCLPLRHFYRDNAGKANAQNRAVAEAQGYFFINLDSDDSLIPGALDAVLAEWATVPEGQREGLSGIAGLLLEEDGSVSGTTYPEDRVDSD